MNGLRLLKKEKERSKEELVEKITDETKSAMKKIDDYVTNLEEASKIVLPVNLLEILEKGGEIKLSEVEDKGSLRLEADGETLYRRDLGYSQKYRIIVICERIDGSK